MKDVFEIGGVTVKPGEKACIKIPFAFRADGSPMFIPAMVVNGAHDGPRFLLTSGMHGDEYDGVEAIRVQYEKLDPATLRGVYIGIPVVNILAFEEGRRWSITDGQNLNRVFPGNPEGLYANQLAAALMEKVVKKADYCVDLHGGGNVMSLEAMAIYREIGPEGMGEKSRNLAKWSGTKYAWNGGGGWGGSLSIEAQLRGVPTITVEVGGEGRFRKQFFDQFMTMLNNLLVGLEMIDGELVLPQKVTHFTGSFICSKSAGFYHQFVEMSEMVKAGQELGVVKDYFGNITERIIAPYDGVILSKRSFATIEVGGWTCMVGKITDGPW